MASPSRYPGQIIKRDYPPEVVEELRGTVVPDCTLAKMGAENLWSMVTKGGDEYVQAMGAMTGEWWERFVCTYNVYTLMCI